MFYSKHYKLISSLHGIPKLSAKSTRALLNTISLESRIDELKKLEQAIGERPHFTRRNKRLQKQLFELTQLDAPHRWLEKLIKAEG